MIKIKPNMHNVYVYMMTYIYTQYICHTLCILVYPIVVLSGWLRTLPSACRREEAPVSSSGDRHLRWFFYEHVSDNVIIKWRFVKDWINLHIKDVVTTWHGDEYMAMASLWINKSFLGAVSTLTPRKAVIQQNHFTGVSTYMYVV